jgi:hypothetical protein
MRIVIITAVLFLLGCAASRNFMPSANALPAMQKKVPGITIERANQGYMLYQNKCSGCHRLYSPSEYTISKWEKVLPEMYIKAKLVSGEEKFLIRDYLFALSK